jgi:hypothetical protein
LFQLAWLPPLKPDALHPNAGTLMAAMRKTPDPDQWVGEIRQIQVILVQSSDWLTTKLSLSIVQRDPEHDLSQDPACIRHPSLQREVSADAQR